MAETIKETITSKEISSEIEVNADEATKKEIGEFLVEQILSSVQSVESPVSGGKYKSTLSKEYKKFKEEQGHNPVPNLEFEGDMLDALDFKITKNGIKVGIFNNKTEASKADGHNNFSGKSSLPTRQFLPREGQKFKADINKTIEQIVADSNLEKLDSKTIRDAVSESTSKQGFFDFLRQETNIDSPTKLRNAILGAPSIVDIIKKLGRGDWLK